MPPVLPPDFPALFPHGFHHLAIDQLEQVGVDLFPLSTTRKPIMEGFREFVKTLTDMGGAGKLWVDGSFLTEKIDPKDIDVLLPCDAPRFNAKTEPYHTMVSWVLANQKGALKCDSNVFFDYPEEHELHVDGKWWYSYWLVKWGFSREEDPKGIVVITFGGDAP